MTSATVPTRRLKYAATINDEALSDTTAPDFELQYIDIGNVDSLGRIHDIATYRFEDAPSRARRQVRHGDAIISTVRTYLQAIAPIVDPPENLIVSTGFAVVRPRPSELDAGFCRFALREPEFLAEVVRRSVGVSYPAINASDLASIRIPLPDLARQRAIAEYLDRETAKLDAMVTAKERLLGHLTEKRLALIAHTITRGLDPCAPMRASGIEWLGSIPKHWGVVPLRYLVDVVSGLTPDTTNAAYWGGSVPWVSPKDMKRDRIGDSEDHVTELALVETGLPRVPVGSVLVVIRGMILVHSFPVAVTTAPVTTNQDMKALRCRESLRPEFLWAYLRGIERYVVSLADQSAHGTKKLDTEVLGGVPVPLPPADEQAAIVREVLTRSEAVDELVQQLRHSLALTHERRAALIAAAVTGALDVEEAT